MDPSTEKLDDWVVLRVHPESPKGFTIGLYENKKVRRRSILEGIGRSSYFTVELTGDLTYVEGNVCDIYTVIPR